MTAWTKGVGGGGLDLENYKVFEYKNIAFQDH